MAIMPIDLVLLLESYDGKSVEPFREAARLLPREPAALDAMAELVAPARPDSVLIGATWVVKDLLENGVTASGRLADQLIEELRAIEPPDAQLHVLQSLPLLPVEPRHVQSLRRSLQRLLDSPHKFVRAWAYNGFGILAELDDSLTSETLQLFEEAERTESASVKARIRNARKRLAPPRRSPPRRSPKL